MPVPTTLNLAHYRGDTLGLLIKLWEDAAKTQPADLSAATVTAQVRTSAAAAEVAADFDVSVAGNEVTLTLTPKRSRDLTAGLHAYDVQVDWQGDDGNVQTVLAGALSIQQDVTHDA